MNASDAVSVAAKAERENPNLSSVDQSDHATVSVYAVVYALLSVSVAQGLTITADDVLDASRRVGADDADVWSALRMLLAWMDDGEPLSWSA